MGTFLAALISQRGQRFREMALDVAKQSALLLVEERSSFLCPLNEDNLLSLADGRASNSKLDPASVHMVLAGTMTGKYKDLQSGLDAVNSQVQPSRLLKD